MILVINIFVIVITIVVAGIKAEYPSTYMEQAELLTWFSAVQLFLIAIISVLISRLRFKAGAKQKYLYKPGHFWLIVACAFLFLGFDEITQLHEQLDQGIHHVLELEQTDLSNRLDDLVLGCYGGLGGLLLWINLPEINLYQSLLPKLKLSSLLIVLMIFFDLLTSSNDLVKSQELDHLFRTMEESCKFLAEGILLEMVIDCSWLAKKFSHR